ncbi:MAG: tRNA pseudouridine(55) synthase TruB [Defluviitaleaceae bacterium]|nr:tRNA pseudouridine(55) synthase TruB [Defluviitaleaceae bacterium]
MNELVRLIHDNDNFVLAGHVSPDGDAIGSCFGLALALDKLGKKVQVVLEPFSAKYNVIPGRELLYGGALDALDAQVFIALDVADFARLGNVGQVFQRAKHTVCVDHHETNSGFAEHNYIDPGASSTAEMTFRIIEKLIEPDERIAAAIYAGIVSDTGGFRYRSTKSSTLEVAGRLMDFGIPFGEIYNELMFSHRFAAAKAFGLVLSNAQRAMGGRIVYSYVTRDVLAEIGADYTDLDGIVEYLRDTDGAEVSCFINERHTYGEVKVSMRSRGADVSRVAATLGGGGHQLAAGVTVAGEISDIIPDILARIEREVLQYDRGKNLKEGAEKVGFLNVYKEPGYTSHDVVAILRKLLGQKSIGHTGTLDPAAEGVLPICLGRATKFADYLQAEDKVYVADLILGVATDTYDISGEVLARGEIPAGVDVEGIIKSFEGEYMQVPPMYSAIKVEGKKLYELARKGVTVERKARLVTIHGIEILGKIDGGYRIEVACSKGTYIRSLCADIGAAVGCGGAMGKLVRAKSGRFNAEDAVKLDELKNGLLNEKIIPVEKMLEYPNCYLKPQGLMLAMNGNALPPDLVEGKFEDKCWLWGEGRNIGLFARVGEKIRAEVMLVVKNK